MVLWSSFSSPLEVEESDTISEDEEEKKNPTEVADDKWD